MDSVPAWAWPLLTLLASASGSWIAVKLSVAKLEWQMSNALEDIKAIARKVAKNDEDLLVHDMEIQTLLKKQNLPRASRQRLRERQDD